jgi:hypothetical protein
VLSKRAGIPRFGSPQSSLVASGYCIKQTQPLTSISDSLLRYHATKPSWKQAQPQRNMLFLTSPTRARARARAHARPDLLQEY